MASPPVTVAMASSTWLLLSRVRYISGAGSCSLRIPVDLPSSCVVGPTLTSVKMRIVPFLTAAVLAPAAVLAAPATTTSTSSYYDALNKRENLCHLSAPPVLCQPNASVTVEETALRAYKFYRAFVVDGDPRTMFSLIDNVYKASLTSSTSFATQ